MSAFRDLMSIVDPTAPKATAPRPSAPAGASKPVSRPVGGANGATQAPQLKRKASGTVENSQIKVQRKDGAGQPAQQNGAVRATSTPAASKPTTPITPSVPYRGTAAPSTASKTGTQPVRKPLATSSATSAPPKVAGPVPKPTPNATTTTTSSSAAPKKGYLALLQKAKEKDSTKPIAPPVKHEVTKILTKKERLALKAEASATAKGKKPTVPLSGKLSDLRADASKDKRKTSELAYQGTARPAKKPEVGYKGTARPTSAPPASSRGGLSSAKAKPTAPKHKYDGYANWDDLDDMEDEEDDYASDASSDMEGGMWDVEQEEQLALKAAKKEDAEALAEEMRLKKEKLERQRKLAALSKAAGAKKKY